jgi:aminotransferase EvaB
MSPIAAFDYLKQYGDLRSEVLARIEQVLASGRLILGPEVQQFEHAFVDFLSGKGAGVAVSSGTDALAIALMALGVSRDEEVITVANTAVPTVSAIRMVGATPIFCDVEAGTGLMELGQIPGLLTERTRAIIPVHLFGNVVDVAKLQELVRGRDIRVLEDCAQAHGAKLRGKMAGTLGDAAAFSFYPTKNLGAFGDAGFCYSADRELVREMRRIRMYGFENGYYSEREGINSRMDELQAAVLNVKLGHLPKYLKRRRMLAKRYDQGLSVSIERVHPAADVLHAYYLYVVKVDERDRIREALAQAGIGTGIHYPHPIHLMRGFRFLGYTSGSLPQTEALAQHILSLPMYPELTEADVDQVCAVLNRVVGEGGSI